MNEFNFFQNMIEQRVLSIHTAFLAKVISVDNDGATVQPLMSLKSSATGEQTAVGYIRVTVPKNVKFKREDITYRISDTSSVTKTVIVPDDIAVGDIVYIGICERDITNAKTGGAELATMRAHDMNDGVILCVL